MTDFNILKKTLAGMVVDMSSDNFEASAETIKEFLVFMKGRFRVQEAPQPEKPAAGSDVPSGSAPRATSSSARSVSVLSDALRKIFGANEQSAAVIDNLEKIYKDLYKA